MADLQKAVGLARDSFPYKEGAFYGSSVGLSLGVGLIYDRVRHPLFDAGSRLFDTVEGLAYVLTHECDVDQANERHFNDLVLICPIVPFEIFVNEYTTTYSESALHGLLPSIAGDRVFKVFYFTPGCGTSLASGGLIFLNQICSTHIGEFDAERAIPLCALSGYAQHILDLKLQNHLLRPKAESLPRLS